MKIYLATPYSHELDYIRHWRYMKISEVAAELMASGHHVFSPITHCHPLINLASLSGDWEFWEPYDRSFIEWCDELHVYKAEGWQESKGVKAEIAIARELGKPIIYIDVEVD